MPLTAQETCDGVSRFGTVSRRRAVTNPDEMTDNALGQRTKTATPSASTVHRKPVCTPPGEGRSAQLGIVAYRGPNLPHRFPTVSRDGDRPERTHRARAGAQAMCGPVMKQETLGTNTR